MPSLQERQLLILNETVAAYNLHNRSIDNGSCVYFNPNAKPGQPHGCAVGRLLDKDEAQRLDARHWARYGATVGTVFEDLPPSIQELGVGFLEQIQKLHDRPDYWDNNGLSVYGQDKVAEIKSFFNL